MRSSLVLSIVACVSSAPYSQFPSDIIGGYFPGRSADVIFKPVHYAEPDAEVIFVDQSGTLETKKSAITSIPAHNVADVITRALGVHPINADYYPSFLNSNFFKRPAANLLLSIESVGRETLANTKTPHFLALTQQTDVSPIKGAYTEAFKLSEISYPLNSLSLAATLSTGTKPFRHGIVDKNWETASGVKKFAYAGASPSLVANVADIVSQSFQGKSLSVSFSGDSQHTSAACLHPKLTSKDTNHHCISLGDSEEKLFGKKVTLSRTNLMKLFSENSKSSVLTALQAYPSDSVLTFRYDVRGLVTVGFEDKGGLMQSTTFDLHVDQDMQFLSELQTAYTLSRVLALPEAASFVKDDFPDTYSISMTTFTGLIEKYGRSSPETAAGLHILDSAVPMLLEKFAALYPDRLLSQVVLMGSHPSTKATVDTRHLFAEVQKLVPTAKIADTFPVVYLQAGSEGAHICKSISMYVKDVTYNIFCPSAQLVSASFNEEARSKSTLSLSSKSATQSLYNMPSPSPTTAPTTTQLAEDVEVYQIVLWLSILMFFVLLFTVYSLACMSFKRDPLLYSNFNPKWDNRKNK